jgi:hypothetical protein
LTEVAFIVFDKIYSGAIGGIEVKILPYELLKLWFGFPSSSRSPIRFTLSLRSEAAAKTITPIWGSTNGMTFRAETNPASLPR